MYLRDQRIEIYWSRMVRTFFGRFEAPFCRAIVKLINKEARLLM